MTSPTSAADLQIVNKPDDVLGKHGSVSFWIVGLIALAMPTHIHRDHLKVARVLL